MPTEPFVRVCPGQESNLQTRGFKPSRSAVGVPGQVVPDGVEPSSPGCGPGVVPLDHGTRKWTHRESHPNFRRARPVSSCSRDKPVRKAEAVRLELTSGSQPPPVFETGSSSSRMTSVTKVPGVGIEPTPSWFRARRHYQQQLPRNAISDLGFLISEQGSLKSEI